MLTENIVVPTNDSWLTISFTSTTTVLFNGSGIDLMYRFGVGSTSTGMMLEAGQTLVVGEAIYIKPVTKYIGSTNTFTITVTR